MRFESRNCPAVRDLLENSSKHVDRRRQEHGRRWASTRHKSSLCIAVGEGASKTLTRPQHCSEFTLSEYSCQQEIRSVELGVCPMQPFHFWSRDVHPVQNLLLCTKFHVNPMTIHWDLAIYRFSKKGRPPSWNCFTTIRDHPRFLLLAAAACQISCQCDTQIWRYSYLNFSHIWLEMPIQASKMGVLGEFGSINVIIHHRDPQKAHPCVNPHLLRYQL